MTHRGYYDPEEIRVTDEPLAQQYMNRFGDRHEVDFDLYDRDPIPPAPLTPAPPSSPGVADRRVAPTT